MTRQKDMARRPHRYLHTSREDEQETEREGVRVQWVQSLGMTSQSGYTAPVSLPKEPWE